MVCLQPKQTKTCFDSVFGLLCFMYCYSKKKKSLEELTIKTQL